jgi:hypothetical protein
MVPRSFTCKWLLSYCILCFIVIFLPSCASMGGQKRDEKSFFAAVEGFNSSFRWEDFKAASMWIPTEGLVDFWEETDIFDGHIRIIDFQIRNVNLNEVSSSGTAIVQFKYYYTNAPHIQTKTLKQQWVYREQGKTWQVVRHELERLLPDVPD